MNTVLAILQLLPSLIKVILAIEEALPASGAGRAKLDMIRQTMEAGYAGITDLWPALEKVISVVVATFNTVGAFKKSTPPAA